jgi:hypothetical protein
LDQQNHIMELNASAIQEEEKMKHAE